jgi:DNA-binding SARP family transcriptional activator
MTAPIIARTRVSVPPAPAVAARARLAGRLRDALGRRALALVASAGWGKTTALAAWAQQGGTPVAWYTADAGDRTATVVAAYLLGALARAFPTVGVTPAAEGEHWREAMDRAINMVYDVDPFVVVIDDAHHLCLPALEEVLSYWLRFAPPVARLVIAGRRMPALEGWEPLRLRGEADTWSSDELAMSFDDVRDAMRARGRNEASSSSIERMLEATGGWPLATDLWCRGEDPTHADLYRAQALRQDGAFEEAIALLTTLVPRAQRAGDGAAEADALLALGRIYVDTVQPARAYHVLRRAWRLTPAQQPARRGVLLDLLAENHLNEGRASAARRLRALAGRMRSGPAERDLDLRLMLRSGQLRGVRAAGEAALREGTAGGDAHRETRLILSYAAAMAGDAEDAERWARQALASEGARSTQAVAWMRLGHALQLKQPLVREDVEEAYAHGVALAGELGLDRFKIEALMGSALLYAAVNEVGRSYEAATEALGMAHKAGDAWLAAWLRLVCGIAAKHGGHPDAGSILMQARGELEQCRDQFGVVVAALWLASSAEEKLQAARAADERGFGFVVQRRTLFGPPPVAEATAVAAASPEAGVLRVQTLGGLRLWREGVEIEPRSWKRGKARELFGVLLGRRGAVTLKEQLMEILWPEGDPAAADRDFRVALHALSHALDPERPKNAAPRWVERRGSAYGLHKDDTVAVDADEFETLVALGKKHAAESPAQAAAFWKRALDLYRGDYLEEFMYSDWAEKERDRLRALYFEAAEGVGRAALASGDFDGAVALAERMLARDKCWEGAWRIMIEARREQGRPALAARALEQCAQALQDELGVQPSPETRALLARAGNTTRRV